MGQKAVNPSPIRPVAPSPCRPFSCLLLSPSERLQPRPFELIAPVPLRRFGGVGHAQTYPEGQPRLLNHSAEIPVRAVFVRGLMVAVLIVVLKLLFAPFIGMADELRAWIEADGRDARLGEREMVGAVEGALLRSGVR